MPQGDLKPVELAYRPTDLCLAGGRVESAPAVSAVVGKLNSLKGLILAQNERWRRGLGMQVERIPEGLLSGGSGERGSKAWVTYPGDRDSHPNGWVIPGDMARSHGLAMKRISPREGLTWY